MPRICPFARVLARVMPIVVKMFVRRGQLLDADVAERDLVADAVVLEADVARPRVPLVDVFVYVFTTVPLSVIVYVPLR